jgi:hypothetical protein
VSQVAAVDVVQEGAVAKVPVGVAPLGQAQPELDVAAVTRVQVEPDIVSGDEHA